MDNQILSPRSIAIVGVSTNPNKISSVIFQNLVAGGYNGKVFPVNPKYEEVFSRKCYSSILDIPESVEQVCIVIPAFATEAIVDECIEKKVKSVVIISAGFKETGEQGLELENRISKKLKDAGIRLIGPNSLGYINNQSNINLSFARKNPGKGDIAFISQSGAFCTAVLDMACEDEFGFSQVVSIGNKADIFENELIELFQKEKDTKAIALYIEEFSDGKEFVKLAQKSKIPLVIIAPGRSEEAKEAISSHTGSLASPYDTIITAIEKGNTILVDDTYELYEIIKLISNERTPKGPNVAVVTNAGGPGILATDNIEKYNLKLAKLGDKTKTKLAKVLPEAASIKNPVDILGDALAQRYYDAIAICEQDNDVDSILVILTPQLITDIMGTAERIIKLQQKTSKPIFCCFLGAHDIKGAISLLDDYNVYNSNNIDSTTKIIGKLVKYQTGQDRVKFVDVSEIKRSSKYTEEIRNFTTNEVTILPDNLSENILIEHGITIPKQILTPNLEDGLEFAINNFPVAIKASSQDLAHKTDFKALYLDIRTISEFETKFVDLKNNISKVTGKTTPDILVQEMISGKAEIFIGANREGNMNIYSENGMGFGHLVAIGRGGIYTEVYKDIEHFLIPTNKEDISKTLNSTKIATIIDGYRGKPQLAKEKLLDMLERIQRMLISYPQIVSMDINPVMINEETAVAVDTKIYVRN